MRYICPTVSMSGESADTRLNFLTKVIGVIILAIGAFLEYMVLTTSLYAALAGMFHLIAIIMIVVGVISLIVEII